MTRERFLAESPSEQTHFGEEAALVRTQSLNDCSVLDNQIHTLKEALSSLEHARKIFNAGEGEARSTPVDAIREVNRERIRV